MISLFSNKSLYSCSAFSNMAIVEILYHFLNLLFVVHNDLSLFQQVLILLLSLLKHGHCLLIDALAQSALLVGKLSKSLFALLVIVGLEVKICSRLSEVWSFLLDPWILL